MRTITIGRAPSCDIIVNDPNVSRIHAEMSVEGGQYVYRDVSTNGTIVNGHKIINEKVFVVPYSSVILANSIPLPWNQVLPLLPLSSGNLEKKTVPRQPGYEPVYQNVPYNYTPPAPVPPPHVKDDSLGFGWGVLAFFLPIAGWIMYFVWREDTPKRARNAGLLGIIGFAVNLFLLFGASR